MNKQNVSVISIIVSLAFLALIAIQIYWIKNDIDLKEEEFEAHVTTALNNTAYKLEKATYKDKIAKKIKLRKQGITDGNRVKILTELSTDSNGFSTILY